MKPIRLTLLFLATICVGCRPLDNLGSATYSVEPVQGSEFAKLNGRYWDKQDTAFGKIIHKPDRGGGELDRSLLDRLFMYYKRRGYDTAITIDIKFISSKKATVSAYQNGSMYFSKNIHGKFKDGYFYRRPKILIIPFLPLVYEFSFEKVRIGKVGNDIIVDHTLAGNGFFLFAGGSEHGRSTSVYKSSKE